LPPLKQLTFPSKKAFLTKQTKKLAVHWNSNQNALLLIFILIKTASFGLNQHYLSEKAGDLTLPI
jgi:hypothetical protein